MKWTMLVEEFGDYTEAMELKGIGVLIRTTVQREDNVSVALLFIKDWTLKEITG